jgi:hypothetical protein
MAEPDQKNTQFFLYLVSSFELAAMQQMGKLKNPLLDKIERNLQQAQFSMELLDMLKIKTKGNLSEDEDKFLEHVLAQLKLNYVEELEKEKKEKQTAEEKPKDKESENGNKSV